MSVLDTRTVMDHERDRAALQRLLTSRKAALQRHEDHGLQTFGYGDWSRIYQQYSDEVGALHAAILRISELLGDDEETVLAAE